MSDRQETIDGLRELADYLEARPVIPVPYLSSLFAFADPERHPISEVARAMGGFEKSHDGDYLNLVKGFTGGFSLEVAYKSEEVCERVVVGTEEVPEKVTPAHVREIVEWKCPESLLAVSESA
jgi:hypothetical protein